MTVTASPAESDPENLGRRNADALQATVLIVDDEPTNRLILRSQLVHDGYNVFEAASGEEALCRIEETPPDLVLLDVMMPGMDGFAVTAALKQRPSTSNIPVILITALSDKASRMQGLGTGAEEFLSKPVDLGELSVRVRNMLKLKRHADRLESDGRHLRDEVVEFAERLNNATTLLDQAQHQLAQSEKLASLGQLTAGIAHEINNPIGYVNSNLASLKRYLGSMIGVLNAYLALEANGATPVDFSAVRRLREEVDLAYLLEDTNTLVDESIDGIERVKTIVHDLKYLSHAETRDEWRIADLHEAIEAALRLANNELKYKADVVRLYRDIPRIACNLPQLGQVFLNIVINAAQAIGQDQRGKVTVSTGCVDDGVQIEISDTGCGIPGESLPHIFDPFFTTKPAGVGTGLGLSLSRRIVEQHGGRIEVDSHPGTGTTFRIILPATPGPAPDTAAS